MTATPRLIFVAFAGFLIWAGGVAGPCSASEAATAMAPPAARLGEIESCRVVNPRFQPRGHEQAPLDAAKFLGGAKLRFLVAAPCPRAPQPFDV